MTNYLWTVEHTRSLSNPVSILVVASTAEKALTEAATFVRKEHYGAAIVVKSMTRGPVVNRVAR